MPRSLRIEYPVAVYHVLNRGNYRHDVFACDNSKRIFEQTLLRTCERAVWILHAFCLLDNHYHLCVETPDANLLEQMLSYHDKTQHDIDSESKSATWKVMIAHYMKRHTPVTNGWLSRHLNMGVLNAMSRYVAAFEQTKQHQRRDYKHMIARIKP